MYLKAYQPWSFQLTLKAGLKGSPPQHFHIGPHNPLSKDFSACWPFGHTFLLTFCPTLSSHINCLYAKSWCLTQSPLIDPYGSLGSLLGCIGRGSWCCGSYPVPSILQEPLSSNLIILLLWRNTCEKLYRARWDEWILVNITLAGFMTSPNVYNTIGV